MQMLNIWERAKNKPKAGERRRTFILNTAQKYGIFSRLLFDSATSPQYSVVHEQLYI